MCSWRASTTRYRRHQSHRQRTACLPAANESPHFRVPFRNAGWQSTTLPYSQLAYSIYAGHIYGHARITHGQPGGVCTEWNALNHCGNTNKGISDLN